MKACVSGMSAYGFSVLFQHRPSVLRHRPNGRAPRAKLARAPRRCCFNTGHLARRSSLDCVFATVTALSASIMKSKRDSLQFRASAMLKINIYWINGDKRMCCCIAIHRC